MTDKRIKTYSSGESLAETLVAALIISLAMIMVFSATRVGASIMAKSRSKYELYYSELNRYEAQQAEYAKEYLKKHPKPVSIPTSYTFTMDPERP